MKQLFILFAILFATSLTAQDMPVDSLQSPLKITGDFRIEELSDKFADQNKRKKIKGYRIQLFSGTKTNATQMRMEFVRSFPNIPAELVFETPAFKLQAANCISELEAQKILQEIRTVFPGAFVVETQIKIPKYTLQELSAE